MTCYSVVINNPTDTDREQIESARALGWRVVGQLEKGESGTPHYQLAITAPVEWKTMKSHFTRANIQEAEDPEALEKYCQKKKTRVVDFTAPKAEKPKKESAYTSSDFFNDVFHEIYEQHEDAADGLIEHDDSLKIFDAAVNQLVVENGYAIAIRATRPDVRSAYRKYRYAMWSVFHAENIAPEDIQDADAPNEGHHDECSDGSSHSSGSSNHEEQASDCEEETASEQGSDASYPARRAR